MGSGCNSTPGANNSCFTKLVPDTGVQYTGDAYSTLGICTGDHLNEIEKIILDKLVEFAQGEGINISGIDLSTCAAFQSCISCCSTCTDLTCLFDCYKKAICAAWDAITGLQTQVDTELNASYNTACLTNLPANPKFNNILQELIIEFCALVTKVNNLTTIINGITPITTADVGNILLAKLTTCQGSTSMVKTGSGNTANIAFKGFVPVGGIIPFGGSTVGKFDSTGLGLAGTEMCGWALCNGNNGTVDMREQVPVGVGAGLMGGGYLAPNANGANYGFSDYVGAASVLLTGAQSGSAAHSHTVSDNGHGHPFNFHPESAASGGDTQKVNYLGDAGAAHTPWFDAGSNTWVAGSTVGGSPVSMNVGVAKTGVTIDTSANVSASQAHENRQPSVALFYIQRVA